MTVACDNIIIQIINLDNVALTNIFYALCTIFFVFLIKNIS